MYAQYAPRRMPVPRKNQANTVQRRVVRNQMSPVLRVTRAAMPNANGTVNPT